MITVNWHYVTNTIDIKFAKCRVTSWHYKMGRVLVPMHELWLIGDWKVNVVIILDYIGVSVNFPDIK